MTTRTSLQSSSTAERFALVARILIALAFAGAGLAKLAGVPALVALFEHIGFGQWFRFCTGTVEIVGAILVVLPGTAAFRAVILFMTMAAALFTHAFVIDGNPLPAIVLLLSGFVGWVRRWQLSLNGRFDGEMAARTRRLLPPRAGGRVPLFTAHAVPARGRSCG